MYNILSAIEGRHQVRSFGLNEPLVKTPKPKIITDVEDFEEFQYDRELHDWVKYGYGGFVNRICTVEKVKLVYRESD